MNETLNLEEYRCRKCKRLFYIDATERNSLDLGFGCPYGCDDNGERERDVVAEIRETADGRVNDFRRIRNYRVTFSFLPTEFETFMGRSPEDQKEFDAWACLVEEGLIDGAVDWKTLFHCACDSMRHFGDEE